MFNYCVFSIPENNLCYKNSDDINKNISMTWEIIYNIINKVQSFRV